MADILLTFHCATVDRDTVADAIRSAARAPIHTRKEFVRGRDFSDARITEQVTGQLERSAVELIVGESELAQVVEAVAEARRRLPVRWSAIPVVDHGRIG
ncbi:MAG: DUF3240 family protein [Novosphingobium sp.]|jgi:hypothetical protein|nr:DUF3240 family protein [Novosphingobium sp.]